MYFFNLLLDKKVNDKEEILKNFESRVLVILPAVFRGISLISAK